MKSVFLRVSIGVALAIACLLVAAAPASADVRADEAFKMLQDLEGQWQGLNLGAESTLVEYEVAGDGTMVVETLGRHTLKLMITIFRIVTLLDSEELEAVHFCASGNVTTMRLNQAASSPQKLVFDFVSLDETASPGAMNIRAIDLAFAGGSAGKQMEYSQEHGRGTTPLGVYTVDLRRQPAGDVKPTEPGPGEPPPKNVSRSQHLPVPAEPAR